MILHIFNKQEKFSIQYMKFLMDSGFDLSEQQVFHYGKSSGFLEKQNIKSVFSGFANPIKHIKLYKMMKDADKVIVHSLASPFLLLLLMLNMKVTKKIYWVIWGKDLYFKQCVNMKSPVNKLYEFFRRKSLKNVKHVITNVRADYDLAVEWYGLDAELDFVEGMSYPYNSEEAVLEFNSKDKLCKVLLGNSASVSNNHLDALDILKKCDDGNMVITSPLSYGGGDKYVQSVISKGKALFGDRFIPLTEFMPLEKYNQILHEIDIAFFFHDRQEAFSNTLTLLGNGKKVYIRTESTLWKYFVEKDILVHDSNKVDETFYMPDDIDIIKNNSKLVSKIRDVESSKKFWEELFKKNDKSS